MKFSIFHKTGEIHFAHNGIDDYDGDEGYYEDINGPDERVHNDIAEMVYSTYIRGGLIKDFESEEVRKEAVDRLKLLFDDIDAWDKLQKEFYDELKDKYTEEYRRGNG